MWVIKQAETHFQDQPSFTTKVILFCLVTVVTHLTVSHQRWHGLNFQLFLDGTQQYRGLSPYLLCFLIQCWEQRGKAPKGKNPRGVWRRNVSKVTRDHSIFIIFPWPFLGVYTPRGACGLWGQEARTPPLQSKIQIEESQSQICTSLLPIP